MWGKNSTLLNSSLARQHITERLRWHMLWNRGNSNHCMLYSMMVVSHCLTCTAVEWGLLSVRWVSYWISLCMRKAFLFFWILEFGNIISSKERYLLFPIWMTSLHILNGRIISIWYRIWWVLYKVLNAYDMQQFRFTSPRMVLPDFHLLPEALFYSDHFTWKHSSTWKSDRDC